MAAFRPTVAGTRHMVAAGHYLAAHAGFEILEAGGNAVDAGVAAGMTLAVVHSEKVSFAGVAPTVIYRADRQELVSIDGLGAWPKAASTDYFVRHHQGRIPPGAPRVIVPGAADAWFTALERYGTMRFADCARTAIRFARDGFVMFPFMANFIRNQAERYRGWPSSAAVFLPGGAPPRAGELFVQADLARTLQFLVDEEQAAHDSREAGIRAARDAFYRGDIARRIATFLQENGGLLSYEDMAAHAARIEPMLQARFGELDVRACGPWCQGPVFLQMLNLLDGATLKASGHNTADYLHALLEAMKLAFADRHRYYGDPRFVKVPLDTLLAAEYSAARRALVDPARACPGMPPAGTVAGFDPFDAPPLPEPAEGDPGAGDTSYICVVDRHGNAFSCTPSDGSGSSPVVPGTGLCPSARGAQSWVDSRHPSAIAPGKRPRLTPSPAMVFRNGKVYMPFGCSGGDVQPQAMLQVLLNIAVFGMDPQEAIEAPRVATYSFPSSFEPHAYFPNRIQVERRIDASVVDALRQRGHVAGLWPDITSRAGAVCAIVVDPQSGILHAGADPRRPAYALGW